MSDCCVMIVNGGSKFCFLGRQDGIIKKILLRINEPDRKPVFICPEIFRGNLYVNVREFFVLQFEQPRSALIESKIYKYVIFLKKVRFDYIMITNLEFSFKISITYGTLAHALADICRLA